MLPKNVLDSPKRKVTFLKRNVFFGVGDAFHAGPPNTGGKGGSILFRREGVHN